MDQVGNGGGELVEVDGFGLATCPCNLAPLYRRHHRLKQAQGFDLTIDPDTNTARWTTPHTNGATAPPWRWTGPDQSPPF